MIGNQGTLMHVFLPGDIMLADRLMCSWTEMVMLKQRGVDCVCRFTSHRRADFRRGQRLGKGDHIVCWPKPARPRTIESAAYALLPESLMVREVRLHANVPGFRSKTIIVATTLLDPKQAPLSDLLELYRERWHAELDLRSLKQTLQMDVLRCKTPDLVRKEIWTHILAYNLIRTIVAQAAAKHGVLPRSISFKGAVQTLQAFQPCIALRGENNPALRRTLYQHLLDQLVRRRVADRPDRFEPRLLKRRPKHFGFLRKTRAEAKRAMCK